MDLAQQMGTTSRTVSYYERETKNPSLAMVRKIADTLGIRPESLLDLPNSGNGNAATAGSAIDRNLSKKFEVAQKLPQEARAQLKKFINTLAKANNIQE